MFVLANSFLAIKIKGKKNQDKLLASKLEKQQIVLQICPWLPPFTCNNDFYKIITFNK